MSINSKRLSMGLSKHQEPGMNALRNSCLNKALKLAKPILPFLLTKLAKIYLRAKYVDDIIFGSTNHSFL